MDAQEAKKLIQKYNAGLCTKAEKALVESSFLEFNEADVEVSQDRIDQLKDEIYNVLPIHRYKRMKRYLWTAAAASILITVLAIAHWKLEENLQLFNQAKVIEDVLPIGNQATLTYDDGKSLALNGSKHGLVIKRGTISYLDGSRLENELSTQMSQTLSTSKGGQYQVVLSDGTKVWLNAASSISYPSSFDGAKERRVKITGEAYFEVAKDSAKPFLVVSSGQMVRVLGTHFNVNSYGDNGITTTTLLEGSVSVSLAGKSEGTQLLKPMQQLIAGNGRTLVQKADLELAMAWKNGAFEFRDASLKTILKEVARWYDLDIEYRGEVPNRVFNGSVSRHSNLSVLLKILSYSDIKFRIETDGSPTKKLIVEP